MGPTDKADWCLKILCLPSGPLRAHYEYILNWLRLLSKINPYYVNLELPDDGLLKTYLANLQAEILRRAQIASGEVSSCMEDVIGSDVAGVRTVPTDEASGQPAADRGGDGRGSAHNVAGQRTFSTTEKLAAQERQRADGGLDSDDDDDDNGIDDEEESDGAIDDEGGPSRKRRRHAPVRVDDPDFAEKMNLILNEVIVIDGEALRSGDPASIPRNVLRSLNKALDPAASHDKGEEEFVFKAMRGEDAVNEYGQTAENFYMAFPCEFPLAKGLTEGISGLPLDLARHLYLQHSCKAAHDSRIYFYAFNMLQRMTAASNAGIRLKNTTDVVKRFMSIVNAPGFLHRLRVAKHEPESEDAKRLVMLISPLLASAGRGIPYSPQARKSSFADFIASYYRFGCNFLFLTMALDDKNNALCIRASHISKRNAGFPFRDEGLRQAMQNRDAEFKFSVGKDDPDGTAEQDCEGNEIFCRTIPITEFALLRLVANNPVAATQLFKKVFDAILECLLAIPGHCGQAVEIPVHHPSRKGVMGIITDILANLEANARGSLHFHAILSGIINAYLLQALVHSDLFMEAIADVFDSMIRAELPVLNHVEHILRQQRGTPPSAQNSAAVIPVSPKDPMYETHVNCCACATNIHLWKHLDSCVNSRVPYCRYCKPSVFARRTGPKLISLVDLDPEHTLATKPAKKNAKPKMPIKFRTVSKVVPEGPPPVLRVYSQPIAPIDTRPITFEVQRRKIPLSDDFSLKDCLDSEMLRCLDETLKNRIRQLSDEECEELKQKIIAGNGWATEFCPPMIGTVPANEAAYPMGLGTAAKSIFCYCCTYITKHSAQLAAVLSLMYDAKMHVDVHKSVAADSGTAERNSRHFFTRLLNRISGSCEYSAPQAIAHFLGRKAEHKLHASVFLYADSAIEFVLSMIDEHHDPDYIPERCSSSGSSMSGYSSFDSAVYSGASSDSTGASHRSEFRLPALRDLPDDGHDLPDFRNLTEEQEFGLSDSNDPVGEDAAASDEDELDPQSSWRTLLDGGNQDDNRFAKLHKRLSARAGSIKLITDKNGNPAVVSQAHDFFFKNSDFKQYSLYEMVCTVRRQPAKSEKKPEASSSSESESDSDSDAGASDSEQGPTEPVQKKRGRGRPAFKAVDFQTEHPLHGLAKQACLKLHSVAIIVPKTPPCPGQRPNPLTPAWKQMARNFAAHMLTVYRPWDSKHGLPRSLTWKGYCDWVVELKNSDTVMSRTRLAFVTLASNNLRFNLLASKLMRHHRAQRATIWHQVAPEDRPRACFFGDGKHTDPNLPSDATRRQTELAMKDLMRRTCIKSSHDLKRDAMMAGVVATMAELFPTDPAAPNGPTRRSDHFPPPDYDIVNCFSVAMVEKVHAENKLSDSAKQAEKRRSKKRRPDHVAPPEPSSKVPADIIWSPDQKELIDTVERYLIQIQEWRNAGSSARRLPPAPTLLVLGGPGNGKTTTLSRITELCAEYNFPLLSATMTGMFPVMQYYMLVLLD